MTGPWFNNELPTHITVLNYDSCRQSIICNILNQILNQVSNIKSNIKAYLMMTMTKPEILMKGLPMEYLQLQLLAVVAYNQQNLDHKHYQ